MKTALIIILLVVLTYTILFETSVSFSPFKISVKFSVFGLAMLLCIVALFITRFYYDREGYKRGYSEAVDDCVLLLKQETKKRTDEMPLKDFHKVATMYHQQQTREQ